MSVRSLSVRSRVFRTAAVVSAAALALSACGSSAEDSASSSLDAAASSLDAAVGSAESIAESAGESLESAASGASEALETAVAPAAGCAPTDLATKTPGKLTIATSEPAYGPWMVDNDPTNKQGYESAVAYAVAEELGFADADVEWIRVSFNAAISPAPKDFDFDINQFSISDERKQAVDFSSGYYDVTQTVVTTAGSPIAGATSVAELKDAVLGAQIGTTSLTALTDQIAPSSDPVIFQTNDAAVQALQNGQVQGLVVDLPTAFYMAGAQLDDGVVVGQLPGSASTVEQFGLLLEKDSPLTPCVTQAVDAVRDAGTLDALAEEWLANAGAPVLS